MSLSSSSTTLKHCRQPLWMINSHTFKQNKCSYLRYTDNIITHRTMWSQNYTSFFISKWIFHYISILHHTANHNICVWPEIQQIQNMSFHFLLHRWVLLVFIKFHVNLSQLLFHAHKITHNFVLYPLSHVTKQV